MKSLVLLYEKSDILRPTLESIIHDFESEVHAFSNPQESLYFNRYNEKYHFDNSKPAKIISDVLWPIIFEYEVYSNFINTVDPYKYFAFMPADQGELESFYTESVGCKVFQKPFDLKNLIAWLINCER